MGTLLLNKIKKQASSFLHEKYKTARLAFTDVTPVELLAEEATNNDPWGPDARTMTKIAEASFDIDDYWRIVDILHRRFYTIDWKQWRQSYKSLVLLEFLLTHGPEDFVEDFQCDSENIQELGTFNHIDEKGFDWGSNMQKRSENILNLLKGGDTIKEARFKALKITKEIQGFGNSTTPSSSSPSSSFSGASRTSSLGSYSTSYSTWSEDINNELNNLEQLSSPSKEPMVKYSQGGIQDTCQATNDDLEGLHLWDCPPIEESGSLLDPEDDELDAKTGGLISGICSKLVGISPSQKCNGEKVAFRSLSDVGRVTKKNYDRQYTMGN